MGTPRMGTGVVVAREAYADGYVAAVKDVVRTLRLGYDGSALWREGVGAAEFIESRFES